jgi:hypothetical protein
MIKLVSLINEIKISNPNISYKEILAYPDEYEITLKLFDITIQTYGFVDEEAVRFGDDDIDYSEWVKFKQYLRKLKIPHDLIEDPRWEDEDGRMDEYVSINKNDLKKL